MMRPERASRGPNRRGIISAIATGAITVFAEIFVAEWCLMSGFIQSRPTVVCLVLVAGLCSGCGRDADSPPADNLSVQPGAETPMALLKKLGRAMATGDRALTESCFDQSTEEGQIGSMGAGTLVEWFKACSDLEKAAVAKYGEGARRKLEQAHFGHYISIDPSVLIEHLKTGLEHAEGFRLEQSSDTADVWMEGQMMEPLQMYRKDDRWYAKVSMDGSAEFSRAGMEHIWLPGMEVSLTVLREGVAMVDEYDSVDELIQFMKARDRELSQRLMETTEERMEAVPWPAWDEE